MTVEAAPLTAARRRMKTWMVVAAGLVFVIGTGAVVYASLRPKSGTTAQVSTAVAKRQTLEVLVSGTGSAVVADSISVEPQISGTVEKLYVSLGETVTAGEKLYTISSDSAESQLLQAKTKLLQAKQSRTQAKQSLQNANNQLYSAKTAQIKAEQTLDNLESQPATTAGLDNQIALAKRDVKSAKKSVTSAKTGVSSAETGVEVAAADVESAQQDYNDAKDATGDTVVTAPTDGVITALPISVGSAVSAGTSSSSSGSSGSAAGASSSSGSVSSSSSGGSSSSGSGSAITIADVSTLQVEVSVSEVDVPSITIGQTAKITFDAIADKTFTGTVRLVSPNGSSSSGVVSYTVDLTLAEQDPRLKPDMTATADIQTLVAENVLVVPNAAVKTEGSSKYVTVVAQNGSTRKQVVTTGASNDSVTQIRSGLSEGASVATGSTTTSSNSTSSQSGQSGRAGQGLMMGGGGPPAGGGPGGD